MGKRKKPVDVVNAAFELHVILMVQRPSPGAFNEDDAIRFVRDQLYSNKDGRVTYATVEIHKTLEQRILDLEATLSRLDDVESQIRDHERYGHGD